ncbi:hypothetical protein D3C81_1963280 [compost metagenome]
MRHRTYTVDDVGGAHAFYDIDISLQQTVENTRGCFAFVLRGDVRKQRSAAVTQNNFKDDGDTDTEHQEHRRAVGLAWQDAVVDLQQGQRQGKRQQMNH